MQFDYNNPYTSTRLPVFARNVVSTSHPLGSQAGLRMLWQGGNAVDAAIAAAAMMTVVEPVSNGLGSDAFSLIWDGKALHGLNASGRAPQAWTPAYFQNKYGKDTLTPPKRGMDSITVPGAVGHTHCPKLPRLHTPRNTTEWPRHCSLDRIGYFGEFRFGRIESRRRGFTAFAN